ncbi:MAG: hypothetical protein CL609_13790 [Anaerolineaceae bacterium]|nr:hypothetical protein [Anaerolineaceae bacterium]
MPNQISTFSPGTQETPSIPLERYLPPYQFGMLPAMVKKKGINGGWILDPLGSQPLAALDLAKSGYCVFVSSNNPILTLMYEVLAYGLPKSEWIAALYTLGTLKIHDERFENFLQKPFISQCPKCGKTTSHVSFIWKKGADLPHLKKIDCSICGNTFQEPISQMDINNLAQIGNPALHQSRAEQRIFSDEDPPPQTLQFLKEAYIPRTLASVVTLFNRLDGIQTTEIRKKIIELYIVVAFDYATTLWPHNQFKTRPRQIVTPNEFEEFNLWLKMEEAANQFSLFTDKIPLTFYPEFPPASGGICLYPHRYRENEIDQRPSFDVTATVLPRPNQALWSFSAIWSGWLWGNQSAHQIKSALSRQRYDWFWLTNALKKIFNQSSQNIPWLGIGPELTSGYAVSYLAAAAANGFRLTDYAVSPYEKIAQFYWNKSYHPIAIGSPPTMDKMLIEYLTSKGDSASYQELLDYYVLRAAKEGLILKSGIIPDDNLYANIQVRFETNLKNTNLITKIDQDSLEFGEYWLTSPSKEIIPLIDRVEEHFIDYINKNDLFRLIDIKQRIDSVLPAYLPSSENWLRRLLESYCEMDSSHDWKCKPKEKYSIRKMDIEEIETILIKMGQVLSFSVISENGMILWKTQTSAPSYQFFITDSSILTNFTPQMKINQGIENVMIYPGSRAELLAHKNKTNLIYQRFLKHLHFVKFRHIRQLSQSPDLSLQSWQEKIDSDPAEWKLVNQLTMF